MLPRRPCTLPGWEEEEAWKDGVLKLGAMGDACVSSYPLGQR